MNFLKKKSSEYSKLNDQDQDKSDNKVEIDDIKLDINDKDDDYIVVECPYCFMKILILKKDFNCKIFRHGVYKKNSKQIDPHMKKKDCVKLVKENKIYGCGKPYKLQVIKSEEKELYFTEICGYV